MNPVMKQNAARGPVACAGSTSVFKCCQKVGRAGFDIAPSASRISLSLAAECASSSVVMADMRGSSRGRIPIAQLT